MSMSRDSLLQESIRYMQTVTESKDQKSIVSSSGVKAITGLVNHLQGKIKSQQTRDILVNIMNDPQLIEGRIYTIGPMGKEMVDGLVKKINNGTILTLDDAKDWIFEAYQCVFDYIMKFYQYHHGEGQCPSESEVGLSSELFAIIRNAIKNNQALVDDPSWSEPYQAKFSHEKKESIGPFDFKKTHLKEKHVDKINGFFKTAEDYHGNPQTSSYLKSQLVGSFKKKLDKYQRNDELNHEDVTVLTKDLIKRIGPF